MSPYLYRRLMHEKLARLRQHSDAASSRTHGAHTGVALALNPDAAVRPHYARWRGTLS